MREFISENPYCVFKIFTKYKRAVYNKSNLYSYVNKTSSILKRLSYRFSED